MHFTWELLYENIYKFNYRKEVLSGNLVNKSLAFLLKKLSVKTKLLLILEILADLMYEFVKTHVCIQIKQFLAYVIYHKARSLE